MLLGSITWELRGTSNTFWPSDSQDGGPMEAFSSTIIYALTNPHTLSYPDSHGFGELLVTEKTGLYFSGVLGGKKLTTSDLTLLFTREKPESQIHQITYSGHLETFHMETKYSPRESLPSHSPSQL